MAIGMDREEIRSRLFQALRSGRMRGAASAAVSRELGYQVMPAPLGDQQWKALNAMLKEMVDAVAAVIEENNRRIEQEIEKRLGGA